MKQILNVNDGTSVHLSGQEVFPLGFYVERHGYFVRDYALPEGNYNVLLNGEDSITLYSNEGTVVFISKSET